MPFLSTTTYGRLSGPFSIRLLSTEQKNYIKYQIKLGAYWTLLIWVTLGGLSIGYFILHQDWLDRQYPAPPEWNIVLRYLWRNAKEEELTEGHGRGVIDWSYVGSRYRAVVGLSENFKIIVDIPSGILAQHDYDRTLPGLDERDMQTPPDSEYWLNRIGFDVSMKSEAWIRGYYEAMMGLCKAAEFQESYVQDTTRNICFPREQMVGPSNPRPRPVPPGSPEAPREENCKPAFDSPHFLYRRLLTTTGFNRTQRVRAGLAYAQWLDYHGETDLAHDMYKWSLGIAIDGLPSPASSTIDAKTAVIQSSAATVSRNLLAATTALASHYARTGAVSAALPIYLSVLRARRAAPNAAAQYPAAGPDYSLQSFDSFLRWVSAIPFGSAFPDAPPSGDDAFTRTAADSCEEAALMAYVGEILFAQGGGAGEQREQGLAWTREATAMAERGHEDRRLEAGARRTCTQCVSTGLGNWQRMVGQLAGEARGGVEAANVRASWTSSWRGRAGEQGRTGAVDWEAEEEMVTRRLSTFKKAQLDARLKAAISGTSSWFVA